MGRALHWGGRSTKPCPVVVDRARGPFQPPTEPTQVGLAKEDQLMKLTLSNLRRASIAHAHPLLQAVNVRDMSLAQARDRIIEMGRNFYVLNTAVESDRLSDAERIEAQAQAAEKLARKASRAMYARQQANARHFRKVWEARRIEGAPAARLAAVREDLDGALGGMAHAQDLAEDLLAGRRLRDAVRRLQHLAHRYAKSEAGIEAAAELSRLAGLVEEQLQIEKIWADKAREAAARKERISEILVPYAPEPEPERLGAPLPAMRKWANAHGAGIKVAPVVEAKAPSGGMSRAARKKAARAASLARREAQAQKLGWLDAAE